MSELLNDISVLFEGMEVTNEQKEKFQTNLEAIISEKVSAYKSEIEAEQEKVIAEKVEEETAELTDKIDDYLSYVVESWAEENRLAIEAGIKMEIMESFIEGMRDVFVEHNVEVPEGKEDMVSAAEKRVAELEDELNESIEKNIAYKKTIEENKKSAIVAEAVSDLTETQKERFTSLIEDVNFSDEETFAKKVKTIRESFFKSEKADEQETEVMTESVDDNDIIKRYANAL
jgi:hypothetical protein